MIKQTYLLAETESESPTTELSEDDSLAIPYPQVTPEILKSVWQQ